MMVTYLSDWEIEKFKEVNDPEISGLVKEIKNKCGVQYYLQERKEITKKLFKKPVTEIRYTMYHDLKNGEFQVMGILGTHQGILTYLYGFLNGLNTKIGFEHIVRTIAINEEKK